MVNTIYELAWIFFIYSFIGWCGEVIVAAVNRHKFVNRGFIAGPLCPIYGTGAVAVAVFLSRMDPTLEEIEDVKTAVSEAVTNAVIHGYQGGEGTITLEVSVEEDVLTVLVQDEGVGIRDVAKAMEPMYTTAPDGERSGMGFSFMEAFMDQVEVVSAPGSGTTVTMRKKIGR